MIEGYVVGSCPREMKNFIPSSNEEDHRGIQMQVEHEYTILHLQVLITAHGKIALPHGNSQKEKSQ